VVSINTALRVMRVFLIRAPTGLVFEHIEGKRINLRVILVQVTLERIEVEQAIRYIVILDAYTVKIIRTEIH
jgi:hypothetical protein